jgi:hypothetical protein
MVPARSTMARPLVFPLIVAIASVAAPRLAAAEGPAPPPPPPKNGPAPDPDRTAALIASSIGFGVGALATGAIYLYEYDSDAKRCKNGEASLCNHPSARAGLVSYGTIVSIVPSMPRFVVGDTVRGLLFCSLRGISVIAAEFAPWGTDTDTKWQGPFLLGFAAPVALGIVDLATTPHREEVGPEVAGIRFVAPLPLADARFGAHGMTLSLGGVF